MVTHTKPRQTRPSDLKPEWHLIDAEGQTLGRLASQIAVLLMGKHRPIYVPNLNTGDFVIVTNSNKIKVTGKKLEQKRYYNHSGYHGGIRERTLADLLVRWPTEAVKHAVKGMLPKNTPGRHMLSRLKIYAGPDHPHEAQLNAGARADRAAAAVAQREAEAEKPAPKKQIATAKTEASAAAAEGSAEAATIEADAVEETEAKPKAAKPKAKKATARKSSTASKAKTDAEVEPAEEAAPAETEEA